MTYAVSGGHCERRLRGLIEPGKKLIFNFKSGV
jgi:hypothetical protein